MPERVRQKFLAIFLLAGLVSDQMVNDSCFAPPGKRDGVTSLVDVLRSDEIALVATGVQRIDSKRRFSGPGRKEYFKYLDELIDNLDAQLPHLTTSMEFIQAEGNKTMHPK